MLCKLFNTLGDSLQHGSTACLQANLQNSMTWKDIRKFLWVLFRAI